MSAKPEPLSGGVVLPVLDLSAFLKGQCSGKFNIKGFVEDEVGIGYTFFRNVATGKKPAGSGVLCAFDAFAEKHSVRAVVTFPTQPPVLLGFGDLHARDHEVEIRILDWRN